MIGTPGITDDVVVGAPLDGCTAFSNGAAISGKFVYVDRGSCSFDTKADFAEAAGATGIIVGQNVAGPPSGMAGVANIPGLMITQAKGTAIKTAVGTVNATMRSIGTDPVDNSYRWLSGEADPAFGGAIRDMWNPTCCGDPGKVTDAEYHCTTDDSGGVHTNSGVVTTLRPAGGRRRLQRRCRAAHRSRQGGQPVWQTQTAHLGPISDFTDLAAGLQASCTELTGQPINKMDITPNAGPTPAASMITPANCTAVTQAIAATELNTEPTQCNFQPLLQQGAPAVTCGAGTTLKNVFTEDFEDGLAGWTSEAQIVYPGGGSSPWVADATRRADTPVVRLAGSMTTSVTAPAAGNSSSRLSHHPIPAFTMPANVSGKSRPSTTTWPPRAASTAATSR